MTDSWPLPMPVLHTVPTSASSLNLLDLHKCSVPQKHWAGRTTFHKDHTVEDIQLKHLVLSGEMSATHTFVCHVRGQSNGHHFKCIKLPFCSQDFSNSHITQQCYSFPYFDKLPIFRVTYPNSLAPKVLREPSLLLTFI